MERAATAGFAAGVAMMIGGALGAVSNSGPAPQASLDIGIMNPMIGGQAMMPGRDIAENIAASPMHTRLAQALAQTGVVKVLKARGKLTLFAPTDAAFAAAGHLSPDELARQLSYLIVPGSYDSASLLRAINGHDGEFRLRTAEGGTLIARMNGPTNILLQDEKGNTADIAIYDIYDSNGVIHVVDRMLEPGTPSQKMASSRN